MEVCRTTQLFVILTFVNSLTWARKIQGPPYEGLEPFLPAFQSCDICQWTSHHGAFYDLSYLCQKTYNVRMMNPEDSFIMFGVCETVTCGNSPGSLSCVFVPGNDPTSAGKTLIFEQLEENVPWRGLRLSLMDGRLCSVTKKRRRTVLDLECQDDEDRFSKDPIPLRAWEGDNSDICTYFVQFPSPHACPTRANKYASLDPQITAVSGCVDSIPRHSTTECSAAGGVVIQIHGLDFQGPNQHVIQAEVNVGSQPCDDVTVINPGTLTCRLREGSGQNLPLALVLHWKSANGQTQEAHTSSVIASVSYKPLVNYRRSFQSFMDLGVGGLTEQITELYQRAFASRSIPPSVLHQLGIEHAKGILLYGPPGSGKTLLARTIAKILNTEQVQFINGPEIMSKFLGESEKNLRVHFDAAERSWHEKGEDSDLFVIIIDEIDAICKPRGKSDSSAAAAAYDSVVNQLLTKMDGLRALHNVLVIGLTNRRELLDMALLRPGRFEVQIEIGLPDETGRWEIFYIHTQQMQRHGYLAKDVDLRQLASNTTQFSGAEIAGVVRLATSYALDRKYGSESSAHPLLVTKEDFERALHETKPAYTQTEEQIVSKFLPVGFVPCGQPHAALVSEVRRRALRLQESRQDTLDSVLLYGPRGVGKSGIVAHITTQLHFTFVKVVSAESLLRFQTERKMDILIETFQEAYKSDFALIILDDLHNLVEEVQIASEIKASHLLLHTLSTLLMALPPQGCRLLVVGTLYSMEIDLDRSFTGKVGLQDLFNAHLHVPNIDTAGTHDVFQHLSIVKDGGGMFSLPHGFNISLRNLLKVTDCVQHRVQVSGVKSSVKHVTQAVMDSCLKFVPHIQAVSVQV